MKIMDEWFGVNNSISYEEFLARNKEVKHLSYVIDSYKQNGRLWVEDKYGNLVLFITDISDGLILEVRCYAPYDPSFILFLLVVREGILVMPRNSHAYVSHLLMYSPNDYKKATSKILQQIKRDKSYKMWQTKILV